MATVGTITANLELNSTAFVNGINQATKQHKQFSDRLTSQSKNLNQTLSSKGNTVNIFGDTGNLKEQINGIEDMSDAIQLLAAGNVIGSVKKLSESFQFLNLSLKGIFKPEITKSAVLEALPERIARVTETLRRYKSVYMFHAKKGVWNDDAANALKMIDILGARLNKLRSLKEYMSGEMELPFFRRLSIGFTQAQINAKGFATHFLNYIKGVGKGVYELASSIPALGKAAIVATVGLLAVNAFGGIATAINKSKKEFIELGYNTEHWVISIVRSVPLLGGIYESIDNIGQRIRGMRVDWKETNAQIQNTKKGLLDVLTSIYDINNNLAKATSGKFWDIKIRISKLDGQSDFVTQTQQQVQKFRQDMENSADSYIKEVFSIPDQVNAQNVELQKLKRLFKEADAEGQTALLQPIIDLEQKIKLAKARYADLTKGLSDGKIKDLTFQIMNEQDVTKQKALLEQLPLQYRMSLQAMINENGVALREIGSNSEGFGFDAGKKFVGSFVDALKGLPAKAKDVIKNMSLNLDQQAKTIKDRISPIHQLKEDMAQAKLLLNSGRLTKTEFEQYTKQLAQGAFDQLKPQQFETRVSPEKMRFGFDVQKDGTKKLQSITESIDSRFAELVAFIKGEKISVVGID